MCGDSYVDNRTYSRGHSWGIWITEIEADVGKPGQERRTCSICKTSETQKTPALQEDLTKKWFLTQYDLAKQQYVNGLNNSIAGKQRQIDELTEAASALYSNYMQEVKRIKERYANAAGTLERALRDAQLNYTNSAKVYTNQITALESEITELEKEIANPNVDNILAIIAQNCNISSLETYEYYYRYSDSIS